MFNNYLHINFSSTLVGVTLLSSQLTFWIITPQWWRHWRPILIELRSFPFIFSLLPGSLAQAKMGRKRTAVMTWDWVEIHFSDKENWAWLHRCSTALRACSGCRASPSTPPAQKPHRQATRIFVQARLSSITDVSGWAGEVPRHQQPFISPCWAAPIWPQQQ